MFTIPMKKKAQSKYPNYTCRWDLETERMRRELEALGVDYTSVIKPRAIEAIRELHAQVMQSKR